MTDEDAISDDRTFARTVDWNLFGLFREIVRRGGVSAAARALNRTQPSVSAGLKRLEAHFGTSLCERTAQGVTPTPAGRAVFDLCEEIADRVRRAPREAAVAAGRLTGSVRVLMISDLVSPAFDRATLRFHQTFPGVAVRLDIAPWRAVVAAVHAGEADFGVACDGAPAAALRYEPLMTETQQLYCGAAHPLFGARPAPPAALADEPFVLTGDDEPEELARFRRRYGLGGRVGGVAETLHEVRRLIQLGLGVGFLPTVVAEASGQGAPLWPLLAPDDLPTYSVYLIARPPEGLGPPARSLLDMIRVERDGEVGP